MIFLVDGDSFYASCERIFRPDLRNRPIAVLTNNDGLIIALDRRCKELGFKRGDVYYQIKARLEAEGVVVFSSNYTLYADISARINTIYSRYAPETEFYSIDESFLFFPDWKNGDYTAIGHEIRNAVKTEIGVPVCAGIAPNKTLAKLCNKLAKTQGGVCEWSKIDQEEALARFPVGDIWGIGRHKTEFLTKRGVKTALDLKNYPLAKAKKDLSITGFKTVLELNGQRALERIEHEARQSISVSRSFSGAVSEERCLAGALAEYTQEAVKRLREDGLLCRHVSVFVMAKPDDGDHYVNSAGTALPRPSSYFPHILGYAQTLLKTIFREGYGYRKVMIALNNLTKRADRELSLFDDNELDEKHERLMRVFDTINAKYGRGTIRMESSAFSDNTTAAEFAPWQMKREFLSPAYTTKFSDIPKAY
ncbi:MAG: Y-family DNA polymerase [Spirochaetaceae bacterium]|jgi:DNA polymerase V|nr:Y-family DNA polymerase [Spirochaetaceae bacterium]